MGISGSIVFNCMLHCDLAAETTPLYSASRLERKTIKLSFLIKLIARGGAQVTLKHLVVMLL